MKKDLENSKILRDELVYIPSGLISEGGTDIMSWTLKEYLSNEELKNKEVYTLNKIGHIFCIKEDDLMVSKAMLIEKEKSIEGILKALEQINKKLSINSDKRQMQLFITIVRYVLLSINDEETRKKLEKEIEKMKGVEGNMLHATMVLNEAFEKREKKGKSEGVKNEKIATAKRLLKKKMKPDFISEITGISIEEIEKLK